MKVSEPTGAKLAQWVARALGYQITKEDRALVVRTPDGRHYGFSAEYGWHTRSSKSKLEACMLALVTRRYGNEVPDGN